MNNFFEGDKKYLFIALGVILVILLVARGKKQPAQSVANDTNPLNDNVVRTYIPTSTTNIEYANGNLDKSNTVNNNNQQTSTTTSTSTNMSSPVSSGEKLKAINIHSKTATYNSKGGVPSGAITHSTDGSPMTVVVVQDTGDGWVQIKTDWGLQWIQPDHIAPKDPNPVVMNLADQWDIAMTNNDKPWMDKIRAAAQSQGLNMGSIMAH